MNGQGTFTFPEEKKNTDESSWEGSRRREIPPPVLKLYEGEFKNGNFHGQGTLTHSNGSIYKGDFKDHYKTGYGVYFIKSGEWYGDKYEGQFKDGNFHGKGTYTHKNGTVYKGEYRNLKDIYELIL